MLPGDCAGLARYPEPLAPAAAAERAGMALPTRDQVLGLIGGLDRPGRLTLVEGAGAAPMAAVCILAMGDPL